MRGRDRLAAAAASFSITMLLLAGLLRWKPAVQVASSGSQALQVVWIRREQVPSAANPIGPGAARQPRAAPSERLRSRRADNPASLPTSVDDAVAPSQTLDLRLPEAVPISFGPDPFRRRVSSLEAQQNLPRFATRESSLEGMSVARDCAELRAALAKGVSTEVILRSMEARGCSL